MLASCGDHLSSVSTTFRSVLLLLLLLFAVVNASKFVEIGHGIKIEKLGGGDFHSW